MTIKHFLAALSILLTINSCTSSEIGDSKDVAQDKIYQSYNITYSEGDEKLSATAVFRFAGENGTTLVLNKPSKVELDDEVLIVDSSEFRGAYYEVAKLPTQWHGEHQWKFTDITNKTYTNDFSFDAFKWDNPPASASKSKPLQLNFITSALGPHDYVEVSTVDSDSSFSYTQWPLTVKPFCATIPVEYLQKQKQSTLKLAATRVQHIRLTQNTAEGGVFIIRYSLNPIELKLQQ